MEAFLKLFNQYDIRVNFIPGFTVYFLLKMNGFDFMTNSELEKVILCYVMGIIVSRLGSILVEYSCKKIGCIKFEPYKLYMAASEKNGRIEVLSETNNLYRSMVAVFLVDLLYLLSVCDIDMGKLAIPVAGVILFLMSYVKQTKYISENIVNTIKKENNR